MDLQGSFHVYDTTLRDGAQQEGLNLSVADKLTIARQLDGLGVGYIEGGWPGANPKDTEFFRRAGQELDLRHARLAAFGATRRAGVRAADDPLVAALRDSGASVVTLVAKSHDRHVELALRTTLEENLAMVRDTVSHLREEGQTVFLDAEHFFDGYRANRDYALEVLRTAAEAGAEVVALCDTNGGMLPDWVSDVVTDVHRVDRRARRHPRPQRQRLCGRQLAGRRRRRCHARAGLHQRLRRAHRQRRPRRRRRQPRAQAGPAACCRPGCCSEATRIAHAVAEVTNFPPASRQPYVGTSAFAHKAGLHASAIKVDPEPLPAHGPDRRRQRHAPARLRHGRPRDDRAQGQELGFDLSGDRELVTRVTDRVKAMEQSGFTFEAADASFELLLVEEVEGVRPSYFDVESWRVITETRTGGRGRLRGDGQAARRRACATS